MAKGYYTTNQAAKIIGVDKSTLLKWIRDKKVKDSKYRDGRRWRVWTEEEVEEIKKYKNSRRGGDEL